MGAAAWGDMNRASNPYYNRLKRVLHFGEGGEVRLNRAMANWYCDPFDHPYKKALIEILGEPLKPDLLCRAGDGCPRRAAPRRDSTADRALGVRRGFRSMLSCRDDRTGRNTSWQKRD